MPAAPDPIVSPPVKPGQPYDATSGETLSGWSSVDDRSGPCGPSGVVNGDFEDGDGGWRQT